MKHLQKCNPNVQVWKVYQEIYLQKTKTTNT